MQWIANHLQLVLTLLLVISEAMSVIAQLLFPNNKGFSGVMATIIKFLQNLGAKKPEPETP